MAGHTWWARTVSNRRHLLCKSSALPLSYAPVDEATAYMAHGEGWQSVARPGGAGAVVGITPPRFGGGPHRAGAGPFVR